MVVHLMLQHATLPIATLTPHARNYRKHPEPQIIRIAHSLARFGQVRSIVVQEQDNGYRIVAGHGVVLAIQYLLNGSDISITQVRMDALRAGLTADIIPADWTESDIAGYLVSDNLSSESAEDDMVELAQLLQEQATDGFDLASLGSSEDSLQHLLQGLADEMLAAEGRDVDDPDGGGDDFDATPDESGPTRTQRGDLWVLGAHRLIVDDCQEIATITCLMDGDSAELLATDPPYGVNYVGKTDHALTIENDGRDGLDTLLARSFAVADTALMEGAAIYIAHPASAPSVTFGVRFLAQGWRLHETLVWVKDSMVLGHSDYHYRHEPILFGYKPGGGRRGRNGTGWYGDNSQTSVLEIPRPKRSTDHPTMKPIELYAQFIQNSCSPSGIVFDPFCGSGTTLIAAERLGRRCRAVEIDPRFADVILRRWEEETGGTATLLSRREEAA